MLKNEVYVNIYMYSFIKLCLTQVQLGDLNCIFDGGDRKEIDKEKDIGVSRGHVLWQSGGFHIVYACYTYRYIGTRKPMGWPLYLPGEI